MTLLLLARHEKRLTRTAIEQGLHHVKWPGRFQVLRAGETDVVIDGAHNPAGIDTFCQTYKDVFGDRKRVFLFSVLADKDYTQMVHELFHDDDYVVCAPAPTPRTSDPEEMAKILPCRADWADSIVHGLDKACCRAGRTGTLHSGLPLHTGRSPAIPAQHISHRRVSSYDMTKDTIRTLHGKKRIEE